MSRLQLDLSVHPLPFKAPLRIAGRIFEGIPAIRVTLSDGICTGRGEAGGIFFIGDDVDHMLAEVEQYRFHIEGGIDREALRALMPARGARNAIDAALWELESLRTLFPVWRLAGLERPRPLITTFTLGADDPAQVEQSLAALDSARAVKLKLDGDLTADTERIRLVRRMRPDIWFMVDANQGYRSCDLQALFGVLSDAGVSLLEQPLPRGCESELEDLDSPVPIAADESLLDIDDLPSLVGRFQVANIKLDKCGGLTEALMIERQARALGLRVMVGNMAGSSLAAAPTFLLGQRCDVVDLDGPSFLASDLQKKVIYENGFITCPDGLWGS